MKYLKYLLFLLAIPLFAATVTNTVVNTVTIYDTSSVLRINGHTDIVGTSSIANSEFWTNVTFTVNNFTNSLATNSVTILTLDTNEYCRALIIKGFITPTNTIDDVVVRVGYNHDKALETPPNMSVSITNNVAWIFDGFNTILTLDGTQTNLLATFCRSGTNVVNRPLNDCTNVAESVVIRVLKGKLP